MFNSKKRISDSDCTAKNTQYKRKKGPFLYVIKGKYYQYQIPIKKLQILASLTSVEWGCILKAKYNKIFRVLTFFHK